MRTTPILLLLALFLSTPQQKTRSEWKSVVPLGVEDADPGIVGRLGGEDGDAAVAAYGTILTAAGEHARLDPKAGGRFSALDDQALRHGCPLLKRRALTTLQPRDLGARRADIILDALLAWDFEKAPLTGHDLEAASLPILLSLRGGHADRLKKLTRREPESVRTLAIYGLGVLGDAYGRKRILEDFQSASDWTLLASAGAVSRSPDAAAEPKIRELMASRDRFKIRAAFTALPGFPNLDVRKELAGLVEFDDAEIQARTLRTIAARRIDLVENVWKAAVAGKLKNVGPYCGGDPIPPFRPFTEVGLALVAADDPTLIDRVAQSKDLEAMSSLRQALRESSTGRIRARLKSIALGKESRPERTPDDFYYLQETLEKSESIDEVLDFVEALGHRKNFSPLHTALYYADPQTQAQKDRIVAMCSGWLGKEGHPLRFAAGLVLHRWGMKEGTEDLLKGSRAGGRDGMRSLNMLGVTPETKPLILDQLNGPEPYMAMRLLALAGDEAVIPHVLEAFKAGKFHFVGGDGGLAGHLKKFKMRDLTDELVEVLKASPHQAHIVSVISYLRWKERKDKAALVRPYLSHPYGLVLEEAAGALADWKDQESFDVMEKMLRGADTDRLPRLLLALMRLDRSRAMPHFIKFLPGLVRIQALPRFAPVFPLAGDGPLVRRLLQTEAWDELDFPRVAGRMFGAEVADALLSLAEDGNVDAATGLVYAGDLRALAAITLHVGPKSPVELLNALDLVVNSRTYPPPGRVKSFAPGPRPGEEAARQIKDAFGVEIGFAGLIPPREVTFVAEQDFLDSLERLGAGRYPRAHVWRNGRIEYVPLPEARAHWISWCDTRGTAEK
jgi:hypothetical protein